MTSEETPQTIAGWIQRFKVQTLPWWLPDPVQSVLKFVLWLVMSIGVTVVCEVGTYAYCIIGENVRPPLEGIPFFRLSVFLFSFILFILFHSSILLSVWVIDRTLKGSNTWRFFLGLIGLVLAGVTIKTFLSNLGDPFLQMIKRFDTEIAVAGSIIGFAIGAFMQFWSKLMYAKAETHKKTLGTAGGVIVALAFLFGVFYQPIFARFLQTLKYGGRVPIVVEYEESGGAAKPKLVTGQLIIRSSDTLIIDRSTADTSIPEIEEVNLAYVRRIEYLPIPKIEKQSTKAVETRR